MMPPPPDLWNRSRIAKMRKDGRRCAQVAEFTLATDRTEDEWKMNEHDRTHIETRTSNAELPIRCHPLKHGRPYTLVVTKT